MFMKFYQNVRSLADKIIMVFTEWLCYNILMSKRQNGNLPCFIRIIQCEGLHFTFFVITMGASEKIYDGKNNWDRIRSIRSHIKEEIFDEFTSGEIGKEYGEADHRSCSRRV